MTKAGVSQSDAPGASSGEQAAAAPSAPIARWAALAALMIAELLVVGVLFDGQALVENKAAWARFVVRMPQAVTVCVAVVAAVVLVGRRGLWTDFARAHEAAEPGRSWTIALAGHLVAWLAFLAVTALLLGGKTASSAEASAWSIAWTGLAVATVGCWALAILPLRGWLTWLASRRRNLAIGVPLGVAAWAVAGATGEMGFELMRVVTLKVAHQALALFYADIVYDPQEATLGTSRFEVTIAQQCAGYQGIGLISVFILGYLFLSRKELRFPQAWLLLPVGVALMWVANIARIVALIAIGSAGWPSVAEGGFHSQAGWLAFNAIALGLVAFSGRVSWLARTPVRRGRSDAAAAYLLPFLTIVATAMVTSAMSAGFDWFYGARVIAAAAVLCWFWPQYQGLHWSLSWQPVVLGAGAFLVWLGLVPAGDGAGAPEPLRSMAHSSATAWLAMRTFGYLFTAPMAEELAFRGFLLRRFVSIDFEKVSLKPFHALGFCGSSLLFGLAHGPLWLPATAAGMLFACAARCRGNLVDAILAHATTNALVAMYVYRTGAWYLWG